MNCDMLMPDVGDVGRVCVWCRSGPPNDIADMFREEGPRGRAERCAVQMLARDGTHLLRSIPFFYVLLPDLYFYCEISKILYLRISKLFSFVHTRFFI